MATHTAKHTPGSRDSLLNGSGQELPLFFLRHFFDGVLTPSSAEASRSAVSGGCYCIFR